LPDYVRVYRGAYERFRTEKGAVNFNDIAGAQQGVATATGTYLTALAALWTSVVDLSGLLQTDDLFQTDCRQLELPPLPDLESLPCCHPCPVVGKEFEQRDGRWPSATPGKDTKSAAPVAPVGAKVPTGVAPRLPAGSDAEKRREAGTG